jgi:hypothetical protein
MLGLTHSFLRRAALGRRVLAVIFLTLVLALGLSACSGGGSNGGDDGNSGPTAPATPTGLSATSQDGAIALDWGAVSGADTYRVYRSTSSGVDASGSPMDTGIGSADYTDETAENGTKYYYVVTAVAEEGGETAESDPSNEVEKTPFSDPPDRP